MMAQPASICVRPASKADAAAIAAIYNQAIEARTSTFETRPRTPNDVIAWFDGVHPIVVVEESGQVIAYAANFPYSERDCYRGVAEFSVYVDRGRRRRGAGRQALASLIEAAGQAGFWKLVSRIFPENESIRRLNKLLGIREIGIHEKHGQLDGVWRDVIVVERLIEKDAACPVRPAAAMPNSAPLFFRPERSTEAAQIRKLTETAFAASEFGHHGETELIERLRAGCSELLSLAAECKGELVGHLLFSPVVIQSDDGRGGGAICSGMGLGPLAVLPEYQRRGIGSRLVEEGLARLRQQDCPFACVLGDPAFYGRFGFQPAAQSEIRSEFGGAEDGAFQIIWLIDKPAELSSGLAKYRPEFSDFGHEPRP